MNHMKNQIYALSDHFPGLDDLKKKKKSTALVWEDHGWNIYNSTNVINLYFACFIRLLSCITQCVTEPPTKTNDD